MSFRKAATHEFNGQLKGNHLYYFFFNWFINKFCDCLEIKIQLQEQLKCLEQRTETQISIYHEINDFCKKRAEIDQDYAKQLDKLAKSAMVRYKSEKTK